jgi:hypothetical protein
VVEVAAGQRRVAVVAPGRAGAAVAAAAGLHQVAAVVEAVAAVRLAEAEAERGVDLL